jgi:hypothetical protein
MRSKHYFEEFKEDIKEEHEKYNTHVEIKDIDIQRCNHKGKVRYEGGMVKCICGAAWSGPQIDTLIELLK